MPKVVNCRKSIINYWVSSLIASLSSEWLYKVIIFTWWASILSKILNWHHMFSKTKNQTVDAINPAWRFSLKRKFSSLSCETRWAIYVVRIFFCRVMWSCQSPAVGVLRLKKCSHRLKAILLYCCCQLNSFRWLFWARSSLEILIHVHFCYVANFITENDDDGSSGWCGKWKCHKSCMQKQFS